MTAAPRAWRPSRSLGVLTLASLGVLAALAIAEIALRALGYGIAPDTSGAYRFHPLLGWEKVPGARSEFTSSEYRVSDRVNSLGLRDIERPYGKRRGVVRVLAIGDSFTEAVSVPREARFTTLLEAMLSSGAGPGRSVEVLNAGTSGYSIDQELLFFLNEGRKYEPDLALLFLYPENDVYDNAVGFDPLSGRAKPRFTVVGGRLQLTNVPLPAPAPAAPRARGLGELRNHLALYRFLTLSLRYPVVVFGRQVPEQFRVWRVDEDARFREGWMLTEALLLALRDASRRAGAELVVCIVPSRLQVSPRDWRSLVRTYRLREAEWDLEATSRRIARICADHGLRCRDLLVDFRHAPDPVGLFYSIDRHLSPRGHRFVAERLHEYLVRELPTLAGRRLAG